ncbi:MAG: DUF4124 domain-containing protein, partial [Gammaproteobacteria bacterium]|nr:DUF4124 domain-containing protein [Gammaproteobacteria bacterium]
MALFLCVLATPLQVSAQMYKWVDEAGTVHYSQSPPPAGIQATVIKPPPAVDSDTARANLDRRLENLDKALETRQEAVSSARETER